MRIETISLFAFILLFYSYIIYLHNWVPAKQAYPAYKKLYDLKIYLLHLTCAIALAFLNYFRFNQIIGNAFLYGPMFFLFFYKIVDWLSLFVNKRHIMLIKLDGKHSRKIEPGQNLVDFILDFVAVIGSTSICIWWSGDLLTYLS
jgi:hypothetical protein